MAYKDYNISPGRPSKNEPQEAKKLRCEIKELEKSIRKNKEPRKRKIVDVSSNEDKHNQTTIDLSEINFQFQNTNHTEKTSSTKITPACVAAVTDNKINGFKIVHNKLWIHVQKNGQVHTHLNMIWLTHGFSNDLQNTHRLQITTGQWKMDRCRIFGSRWVLSIRPNYFGSSLIVNAHLQQNSRTPLKYYK
jgi:hypothetical protein